MIPIVPTNVAIRMFHLSIFPRVFFKKHIKYLTTVVYVEMKRTLCSVFLAMCATVSKGLIFVLSRFFLLFENQVPPEDQCRDGVYGEVELCG